MNEIEVFLESYCEAVKAGDIDKIIRHFHTEFTFSTKTELFRITNNDIFKSNMAKTFYGYKKLGMKDCKILKIEIVALQSNQYIANIEWGLMNSKNVPFIQFDISYCIKSIDGRLKYIFVIDHNEIERIHEYKSQMHSK